MAAFSIDHVLAEMSKTGKPNSGRAATPRPDSKLESGEVASPPKPIGPPPLSRHTSDPSLSTNMPRRYIARRHFTSGPIPAPGTPQDRFAAVLGRSNSRMTPVPHPMMGMNMHMGPMYPNPSVVPAPTAAMHTIGSSGAQSASQPVTQTPSALAVPRMGGPPMLPVANTRVVGNGCNGVAGRGPTLPEARSSATQWLSYECQRRHFNPAFTVKETRTKTGGVRYQCTVYLQDNVVVSNTQFDNPAQAKTHAAERALRQLRREWPIAGSARRASNVEMGDTVRRQEELRQHLTHLRPKDSVETPQPETMPSSTVDMGDPIQARAFVEGYKMGQSAAQRAAAGPRSSTPGMRESMTQRRTRSRSPTRNRSSSHSIDGRRHRHRSPLRASSSPRRYYDGSRHDPRLPSTDRYRPCHPEVEDRHGRLRDFDIAH